MKKLLVILMLGAGFVTVASAEPVDCTNNNTDSCCIDVHNMQSAIAANPNAVTTSDGLSIISTLSEGLDEASNNNCWDSVTFVSVPTKSHLPGIANWTPGQWTNTLNVIPHN